MAPKKTEEKETVEVQLLSSETIMVNIKGVKPLIYAAMSEKSKGELLFPGGKKTTTEKRSSIKHDPIAEYRNSVYAYNNNENPTRLCVPATMFKGALMSAALEVPGITRASTGRLCWVEGPMIDIYGVPEILMSVVKNSDANKTPDIRTRAILRQWCCTVSIKFIKPRLTKNALVALLANAGMICGIGDWRPQKGYGDFGQFEITEADDPEFVALLGKCGIKEQDKALLNPGCFDLETQRMISWFLNEADKREKKVTSIGA